MTFGGFLAILRGCTVEKWLVVAVVSFGCTSHKDITPDDCIELRDHIVDLRLSTVATIRTTPPVRTVGSDHLDAPALPPIDVAPHRAALKQALGEQFESNCLKSVTVDQLKCALAAKSSGAVTECLKPSEVKE